MEKPNFLRRFVRPLLRKAGIDVVRYLPPVRHSSAVRERGTDPVAEGLKRRLQEAFPFPDPAPDIQPFLWSLDGGGKEIIEEKIEAARAAYVVEVGTFLGGSTEHWLRAAPEVFVICIDPWDDGWAGTYAADNGYPQYREQLNRKDGFFHTFLANMSNYRERVAPVRDRSPQVLVQLLLMGLQPEVIFFDANKISDDLIIAHRLWPEAILSGDDWHWGAEEGYPVQKMLKDFAGANGFDILQKFDTWMLIRRS